MPSFAWSASGSGTGRTAVQVVGVPLNGDLVRSRLRAPSIAGATTVALHFFTRVCERNPPLGWILRPGNVDPATVDQLNLSLSKTGISLTASASATTDSTVPTNRALISGELWVIVDVTVAAGAWSLIGVVDIDNLDRT